MGALRKPQFGPSRSDSDWRAAKALKNFAGFIFVCTSSTIPDPERGIFGLPGCYEGCVRNIRRGMPLFLFNHSNRYLYGVFEAASDGGYNIDPYAWENMEHSNSWRYTNPVSKLPAQVRVSIRVQRPALEEESFRPILDYVEGLKFRLELTATQVQQLLYLFDAAKSAERRFFAERNRVNQNASRDPESPRSIVKSDSDSHSDCSSRGLNSCEDEWTEEGTCENLHYQHGDNDRAVSERLQHIALDERQHQTSVRIEESTPRFGGTNDMHIPRPMAGLPQITAGLVEALHFEILQFARWTRPSSEIQLHVEAAIDCVRKGVKIVWPEADVEVFGSFATGLCLQHSDVDLVVIDAPPLTSADSLSISHASASLIRELAAALRMHEWCESIKPLDTASMPVLKCLCRPFGASANTIPSIAVDITIGGMRNSYYSWNPAGQVLDTGADQVSTPGKFTTRHTGGEAREYVLHKIQELPALAPLVLLLKSFLHHRNLSNVYSGGLGSFSLTLLVAFFLERVGSTREISSSGDFSTPHTSPSASCLPDLPDDAPSSSCSFGASIGSGGSDYSGHSLGERYVRRAADAVERVLSLWDQDGLPTLGSLLLGFLLTFGFRDLSCEKIVLKGIEGSPGGFLKRDNRHVALWIDDPVRPGVNIGAGSFGMVHVQTAFKEMMQALTQCRMFIRPLQCDEKDCQDLVALSQLTHIRRLVVATDVL